MEYTKQVGAYTVNIVVDEDPENPFFMRSALGTTVVFDGNKVCDIYESEHPNLRNISKRDFRSDVLRLLRKMGCPVVLLFDSNGGKVCLTWKEIPLDGHYPCDAVSFIFRDEIVKEYGRKNTVIRGESFTPRQMAQKYLIGQAEELIAWWQGTYTALRLLTNLGTL